MNKKEALKKAIQERAFITSTENQRIIRSGPQGPVEMPWLFDFRAFILEAQWLNLYAELFWEKYEKEYPFQVGGLETASIALISAIVMKSVERKTPVNGFFIRKSRKREGLMKQIEGRINEFPIILVDDLINSGGSFKKQLEILKDIHAKVSHLFAILAFRHSDAYTFATDDRISVDWLYTLADFGVPLQKAHTPETPSDQFEILWHHTSPNPSFEHVIQKSVPCINTSRVYVGTDAGTLIALEQNSGNLAWSFETQRHPPGKGIFSSPALYDDTVYFGGYDGNAYALDSATGRLRWKNSDADWIGSSPDLAPDLGLLYIGLEFGLFRKRGGIAAINMKTGATVWTDRTTHLTHGSPLYIASENMVVIGSNDGVVYAYDARTGDKKWQYQTEGDIKTRPAYDARNKNIIVNSMDCRAYALSVHTGVAQWAYEVGGSMYSTPCIHESTVYVSSLDKHIYAIDTETGKKKAEFATLGRIFASPIVADGSIWIGSNDGRLYELAPETLKQKGFHQFSERIVSKIAFNSMTKDFFVKTIADEIYCLRKK